VYAIVFKLDRLQACERDLSK